MKIKNIVLSLFEHFIHLGSVHSIKYVNLKTNPQEFPSCVLLRAEVIR